MMNNNHNVNMSLPLVSIICLTYNQEEYVRQTLESLLMQRTSFPFEIIIHDDASTDDTKIIIEQYVEEFSHIIKPIYQYENKYSVYGISFQYKYVFSKAKGKYIAMCAGDDFWIDPLKLQKQVDFLENNSDYGLVHTKAAIFNEAKKEFEGCHGFEVNSFESLLNENAVAALTVCLRSNLLWQYLEEVKPEEHEKWTAEDFPTWLWFMQNSKFEFIEDITSVYRKRAESISHVQDDFKRLHFAEGIYDIVNYYLCKYAEKVTSAKKIRARYYSGMINTYFLNKKWSGISKSAKIFYDANDWLNLMWILLTMPFFHSKLLVNGSYRIRSLVFDIFNIYPIRK